MPLSDFISVTTRYASPPLGIPSLTVPLVGWTPTSGQRTAWSALYGATATPNVQEVTPTTWEAFLEGIGVTTGEALQTALTDLFSQKQDGQPLQPATVLLALRQVPVALVVTATVGDSAGAGNYTTTLNGTDFVVPFNTDAATTAADIRTAINGGSEPVTAGGAGVSVTLTADVAGVPFTWAVAHSTTPADYTAVVTTPNVGLPEDITLWDSEDPRGYFLLLDTRTEVEQLATARAWETRTSTRPGQYWAQFNSALAQTGASSLDPASVLTGEGLTRTRAFYHSTVTDYIEFALCGKICGFEPGVPNHVHQSLISVTGISLPALTSTATLETKRYSFLERYLATVPPTTSTRGGKMLDGNWSDLVHGADAVNRTVEIRVYESLLDANTPYFGGEPTIDGAIKGALAEFEGPPGQAFLVAGQSIVTVPPAASQAEADRLNRLYDDVSWSAPIQGKVNAVTIQGFLAQ